MHSEVWGPVPQGQSSVWKILNQSGWAVSSQWEEDGLLVPLQLVDGINTTADIQPALPLRAVWVVNDSLSKKKEKKGAVHAYLPD